MTSRRYSTVSGLQGAIIAGHSLGGMIGQMFTQPGLRASPRAPE
jgi:hypothetical protein